MSHNYLLDTYHYLQQRLQEIQPNPTSEYADEHTEQYAAGQIEAICDIERFLKERYDIKLPRRMRNQQTTNGICKPDEKA